MDESDLRVRLAAFAFLDEQRQLSSDLFERRTLQRGFDLDGERVPLQAPQGIFKPRICRFPLSITTVPVTEGQPRPYDDAFGVDGLLRYRYRGTDPNHHDNRGLREAMRQRLPLIYFHGIVEGKYEADYPVFVVGDTPESLTFTVSVDERRFASLGNISADPVETDIRRRYVTRTVQHRLHQQEFRERVLAAYRRHCAICRLKREQLLEAAHIVADAGEFGAPVVPNGIALCKLHHGAFDAHLIACGRIIRLRFGGTFSRNPTARCSSTDCRGFTVNVLGSRRGPLSGPVPISSKLGMSYFVGRPTLPVMRCDLGLRLPGWKYPLEQAR